MDLKSIKALYKFLQGTDLVECEVEDSKGKIRLVRASKHEHSERSVDAPAASVKKEEPPKDNIKTVTSPMVGTFYRAPSPEAPNFIEMGSIVKNNQIVCIIEAMKIMNEVETDYSGKIVAIHVENGQPVEYGEPIFSVEA